MSPDILLNVIENLKTKYNLTEYQIKQLSKSMKTWKLNDRVYPSALKSRINVDIVTMYKILEEIKDMGILETNYEVYCFECSRFKGKLLRTLTDMPEDLTCDFCNHTFDPLEDTIKIYRVIKDE
ncbi:hypothetical protein SAMN02745135_02616 [Caloranaerobacter azorensis DSM 13643]|uniref:Uncharacterized protein n=1 Tax=Caloranaerobacter azorensis DSM 13643 TaxID=1121264 RepID=A0A1M5WSY9_9FIRM|nr:hypothetical protein [Caloranaerobacter azorensis]SHH90541.1 hypothetical protein SAMN02745135_02616 [Caloranaerobacter azorensis DSM 13643]